MTINVQPDVTTSNLVVGRKESVSDDLLLLNPVQIPLVKMLGVSEPVVNTHHVWYEDEMFGTRAPLTAEADASATELEVEDASVFREDHLVMFGNELMKVTAVNKDDNKVTVIRGYSDTEAEELEAGDVLEIQLLEGQEGMDAIDARYKSRKKVSNVTQVFTDSISISGTQLAVENHGINDLYTYEQTKVLTGLGLQLERALLNGVYADDGTLRRMKGIRNFIETNVVDLGGKKLDYDTVVDALELIADAGGFTDGGDAGYEIVVGSKLKRAISKFGQDYVRTTEEDDTRGIKIDYLTTEFGTFPVTINNNLPADEVLIIDKNRIKIRPLKNRAFFHEYLGNQGDFLKGMVVGEYTLEFHQEKAHALIKGASPQ